MSAKILLDSDQVMNEIDLKARKINNVPCLKNKHSCLTLNLSALKYLFTFEIIISITFESFDFNYSTESQDNIGLITIIFVLKVKFIFKKSK